MVFAVPAKNKNAKGTTKKDFHRFVAKLENMILTGGFKPRERLVEANLSQMFGVSRYWVRDAFKILETKKLITVIPFKGVVVSEMGKKEVHEIFVIRVSLEQLAIKLAVEMVTPEDIVELRRLTSVMEKAQDERDVAGMVESDTMYHDYIFKLADNLVLRDMILDLRKRCHIIRYSAWSSPDVLRQVREEHRLLVDFLEAGDADKLSALAEKHISHAKDFYLFQLSAENVPQL